MDKQPTKKRIGIIEDRLNVVQKQVRELRDILNVSDNWGSITTEWRGRIICVKTQTEEIQGELEWVDRYHIGIKRTKERPPTVIMKGSIQTIDLVISED